MIFLLGIWILLMALFSGVGACVRLLFRSREESARDWFHSFWLGWATVLALLQILNFFLPVVPAGIILTGLLGIAGTVLAWKMRRQWLAQGWKRNWLPILVWVTFGAICAINALKPMTWNDSARYHLEMVKWASEYAVVPGLANLHWPNGSSGSYFLYAAMMNIGPLMGQTYLFANGLLGWVVLGQAVLSLKKVIRGHSLDASSLFNAFLIAPILLHLNEKIYNSLSPDSGLFFLEIAIAMELLALLTGAVDTRRRFSALLTLSILCAAGMVIKLSFSVFGFLVIGAALFLCWKDERTGRLRTALAMIALVIFLVVPSLARTAVLTGYLGYPTTLGALPVDWRVPESEVEAFQHWVTLRAHYPSVPDPHTLPPGYPWFDNWFASLPEQPVSLLRMAGLIGLFIAAGWIRKPSQNHLVRLLFFLLLPILALTYWFLTAPAYRFAGSLFWILGVGVIILGVELLMRNFPTTPQVIPVILLLGFAIWVSPFPYIPSIKPSYLITLPPPVENPPYTDLPLSSTISLHVAKDGALCWNIPLPCSSYYQTELILRDPNNLQAGFLGTEPVLTDGASAQQPGEVEQ